MLETMKPYTKKIDQWFLYKHTCDVGKSAIKKVDNILVAMQILTIYFVCANGLTGNKGVFGFWWLKFSPIAMFVC
jgi:hypothetical protein